MTTRVWVGGHSGDDVTDPLNWSPNGFAAGDVLILQSGTLSDDSPNPVLNGTDADPILIVAGGTPVIDLSNHGSIIVQPATNEPAGVTINVSGDPSVRFEGGEPSLAINAPGAAGFDVAINLPGTAGLFLQPSSMGAGTLTVNGAGGVVALFAQQNFAGTDVTVNAAISGWSTEVTGGPGIVYLSDGAVFRMNGSVGYDLFYVGENSAGALSPATLILGPGERPTDTVLRDGYIELQGFQAYRGNTPAVSLDLFSHQGTVLAADGSVAFTFNDPANDPMIVQNSVGLFIASPGASVPGGGTQVNTGYFDNNETLGVNLERGTSGGFYDTQGNQWAIDAGGQVTVNGTVDPTTANVELLVLTQGTVWQENSADQWWSKTSASGAWVGYQGSAPPVALPTPASANGTVLTAGSNGGIQDAEGNLWTVVNGQVAVNGFVEPTTADVVQLDYSEGRVWQENSSGLWWSKAAPADSWAQGTDPLASPDGVAPLGPPNDFSVVDQTSGGTWQSQGVAYTGPVAGLSQELLLATSDNINVTAEVPNVFIHSGAGEDGLNVSGVNGDNVLDGSTGSNFLIGGTGTDQFYVDDRNPAATTWSTVVNFHSGDNATIWGITQAGYHVTWLDGQGAQGATGLTGVFVSNTPGQPEAAITLAGYTSADLTNGTLSITYGKTQDLPGLPGSDYVSIHAV